MESIWYQQQAVDQQDIQEVNQKRRQCPLNVRAKVTLMNVMLRTWIMPTLMVQGLLFMDRCV